MIDINGLVSRFQHRYGKIPRVFRAPGRINLIGEHTDYNDGYVLPIAINQATYVAIASRSDRMLRVWSLNIDESIELNLDKLGAGRSGKWQDYIEGMAAALINRGALLRGSDIALNSDIPIGGGLSSSAALEMALGMALTSISDSPIDKTSLALAGQRAEHIHVGIQSGIMDQFTAAHAVEGHALLLDCRSLNAKSVPVNLGDCQIVICDSKIRHRLASSEYNLRRRDCETGVKLLSTALPGIRALRDVTLVQLEGCRSIVPDTVFRRCRHVVSENERTLIAADALAAGDLASMGALMSASHQSLRDDYEVSCFELDLLVQSAQAQPGVFGARMTGGGFGGCTVNLVRRGGISSFRENVSRAYRKHTGIIPGILTAEASGGAEEILLP